MNPVLASIVAMLLTIPLVVSLFFFPTANLHIASQRDAHLRDLVREVVDINRNDTSNLEAELNDLNAEGVVLEEVRVQEQDMYLLVSVDYSYEALLQNKFAGQAAKTKTISMTVDKVN